MITKTCDDLEPVGLRRGEVLKTRITTITKDINDIKDTKEDKAELSTLTISL